MDSFGRTTATARSEPTPAYEHEVRSDQVSMFARNVPVIIVANLVNALLTVMFFQGVTPAWILGVWLLLTVMLSAVGSWVWWERRDPSSWANVDASVVRRITLCAALGGGLWGVFASIVFPPESVSHQVLLALAVGTTAAASLVSLQSIPLASAGYILLSLVPLIICFGRVGEPLHWFVTEMLTAFAIVLIALSHNGYATFVQDVRLRRENAELQKADAANRAKSIFLGHMSHELRTPLNAIIGLAEMMQLETLGPVPTQYRSYAGDIRSSGTHLLNLVNDLLDLSKIEADKVELAESLVDLIPLIDDCLTLVAHAAASAGIALTVEAAPELQRIYADQRRLKQILINLLSNAVKFTGSGGAVAVVTNVAGSGDLEISVRDNGIGIRSEDIAKVLKPFGRLSAAEVTQPGTGLGLSLSQKLAELHGGALEIESAIERGTTVRLRLPATRLRATVAAA